MTSSAIAIESFREAIDLGSQCRCPATTDEAQYSLPFPVAAALVFGAVGADEIGAAGLDATRASRACSRRSRCARTPNSRAAFRPSAGRGSASTLADGRTLVSEPAQARGGSRESAVRRRNAHQVPRAGRAGARCRARSSRIAALAAHLPIDAAALPALVDELLSPAG